MTKELYQVQHTADIEFYYKKKRRCVTVTLIELKKEHTLEERNGRYEYLFPNEVSENEKQALVYRGSVAVKWFAKHHRKQFDCTTPVLFGKEEFLFATKYCIRKQREFSKELVMSIPLKDVIEIVVHRHYKMIDCPNTKKLLKDLSWEEFFDYAYETQVKNHIGDIVENTIESLQERKAQENVMPCVEEPEYILNHQYDLCFYFKEYLKYVCHAFADIPPQQVSDKYKECVNLILELSDSEYLSPSKDYKLINLLRNVFFNKLMEMETSETDKTDPSKVVPLKA